MQSDYHIVCSSQATDHFVMLNVDNKPEFHLVGYARHNMPGESLQFTIAEDIAVTPAHEGWELSGPFQATLKPTEDDGFALTLTSTPEPVNIDCRIQN